MRQSIRRDHRLYFGLIVAVVAATSTAFALINPDFTPVQLVRQSEQILRLKFGPLSERGDIELPIDKALAGDAPEKFPVLSLRNLVPAQAEQLKKLAAEESKRVAMLFISKPAAGATNRVGLLHLGTTWYRLAAVTPRVWQIERVDATLQATWAGSSEMLAQAADYILADPDAVIPAKIDASWLPAITVGKIAGEVRNLQAVRLTADQPTLLYVQTASGDRLFQWQSTKKEFADVTDAWKLKSRAVFSVWGDFDRDGRIDLATFDGRQLQLWLQRTAGQFSLQDVDYDLTDGCRGLECGPSGQLAVFAKSAMTMLTFEWNARDEMSVKPLTILPAATPDESKNSGESPPTSTTPLTPHGDCLAIALSTTAHADLLEKSATNAGCELRLRNAQQDLKPVSDKITLPTPGPDTRVCAGDFDGDGKLDLLLAGKDGCRLWSNLGDGKFADHSAETGELHALSKTNANSCCVCDINHDGRPDIAIGYRDRAPQIFFNRGFHCFGLATSLSLDDAPLLAEHGNGTQAIAMGDLIGEGRQDLAMIANDGMLIVLPQKPTTSSAPVMRLQLGATGISAGTTTVIAQRSKYRQNAWYLRPGEELQIGGDEPGKTLLAWQFEGYRRQQKTLVCEPGQLRFDLRPPRTENTDAAP